jgi:hypothetical protein
MMCGKRWPINGQKQATLTELTGRKRMEKTSSGKTGPCINCGRTKFIANRFGHCSSCSTAVKDLEPGSGAYTAALASAKERLSSGNVGRAIRAHRTEKPPRKKAPAARKSTLDPTIKEVSMAGLPGILQIARDEQAFYLSEAEKLGKAINILESLQ